MAGKFSKYSVGEDKPKPTRYYSSKQEKQVAKAIGGKQTANSGATMFQKGDVLNDLFLIECKTKTKASESFTIHKDWIEKNKNESIFMHKQYNALAINFGPDEENYYLINEELFGLLVEYLHQNEE